jgi:hypothetical protein
MGDLDFQFVLPPPLTGDSIQSWSNRYLIVHLDENGQIYLQGSREEVESFLLECTRSGLWIGLDYLNWCG